MLLLHLKNAIDDNPPVELAANHLFDVCSFVVMNSPADFQIKLLYSWSTGSIQQTYDSQRVIDQKSNWILTQHASLINYTGVRFPKATISQVHCF